MTEQVRVPDPGDDDAVFRFAHSYNGYELHGGLNHLSEEVRAVQEHWQRTGELGDDLDRLRGCLFFEARGWRHAGGWGSFARQPFVAALLTRIRSLSGGSVPARGTVA